MRDARNRTPRGSGEAATPRRGLRDASRSDGDPDASDAEGARRRGNGASATQERRAVIREVLASRQVATQEELRELLAGRGHDVTQATLSRDLAQLGARRAAHPGGGTYYELPDVVRAPLLLVDLVRTIDDNGTLVVVHTSPGAAQVVASAFDRAKVPEVLGTIAGDDAIFVAPARGVTTARVIRKLRDLIATAR